MLRTDDPSDFQVYSCTFQFHIQEAQILIKFPCTYTFQLKSMDNKITLSSTKNKVSALNSIATFNQKLRFETDLLYSRNNQHFISKEILLIMNLISLRRPDQQKMVGRVTVNLVDLIQNTKYFHLDTFKLDYCSVNVNVRFYAKFMGKKISHTLVENFDRDSFSDFQSFVGGSKIQKNDDETDKTLQMGWKNRTNQNLNVIVEQDKNQEKSSRRNARTSHKIVNSNSDQNFLQMIANSYQNQSHEQESKLKQQNFSADRSQLQRNFQTRSEMPNLRSEHQYEQIMKGTRLEQKRIWEEQKKFLSEQISKQKEEVHKLKEKNEILQRKVYENELKICSMEGRIESCRREMAIVQKQKSLQRKQMEVELQKKTREMYEKSSVLALIQSQIKGYVERIVKYEDQFRQFENIKNREVRMNVLQNQKLGLIKKIEDLETLMIVKNNQLDLKSQQIKSMKAIQNINLQLSANINALNNQIATKNSQILQKQQTVKGETDHLVSKIQQQKQYIQGLEKEVLFSHQKTSQYIQQISSLSSTVTNYTATIQQLKEYTKNLQQQVLNQSNIKQSAKEKEEMERYAFIIDSLNIQVNEMNIEIEKLNRQKEESKEYILELEKNILNRQDQAEETNNIKTLKQQEIIHLKEYQKGIETELISMHDQIQHKPSQLLTQQTQVLNRIAMLEETIEQQKIYAKHLEQKILEDHNEQIPSLKKIEELQSQLQNHKEYEKNLEARILQMTEEQNGRESKNNNEGLESMLEEQKLYVKNLQSKILDDHINQQNYIDRINALEQQFHISKEQQRKLELKQFESCKRLEQLQQKLFHQREYQQGLEERILNDHQNISNEHELKNSICLLKDTIKQQKQYQQGLEQRILYDHQDKQNGQQSQLKQSLNIMKSQLQKQKEYQEGLEEKILQDYHYLQTQHNQNVNVSYEGEVNQPKNQQLEHQKRKSRQLQDTITQKQEYITELEANLSAMQREIYCLEEKIQQMTSQNVYNEPESPSCKLNGETNQNQDGGLGTIIRVISVHSQQSDKDDESEVVSRGNENGGLDSLLRRGSVAKSQISQPPSLRERQQISDDLSYKSSPRKNKLQEIYDSSPNRGQLMTIRTQKQEEQGSCKKMTQFHNDIDVKQQEITKFKQSLHNKQIQLSTLNRQINLLKTSNEKLMKKSHQHTQFQSSFSKLESKLKQIQKDKDLSWEENKTLQRRLNQVEKELQLKITQISQMGLENERLLKSNKVSKQQQWELQKINQQYEIRIKMLKQKELKIQEALVIIEEQSVNIANELELREREKEQFKVEIEILQQRIFELERNPASKGNNKMNYSPPHDMSFKEDLDNLMVENQKKNEQIYALKKKISIHSENSFRYESLLAEIEEKHHENEERQTYIKGLQQKLKSYQHSSICSQPKDRANISQNRKEEYLETRVEQLEEQLFSLKANQNQKDLQIERLKNQILDLKQTTTVQLHTEIDKSKPDQMQIAQFKITLEHQQKLYADKLAQKQNKLIGYQKEFAGLQNILQLERDQYESKMNEAISYNDKALKTIEELDQELSKKSSQLQQKQIELQELKGVYLLTQKQITRLLENEDRAGLKIQSSGAIEDTNFDELKGKIEYYQNEIEKVNKKYNEVQLKLIQTQQSAERGRAKINELQIQIQSINIQKDNQNKSHLSKSANLNKKKLEQEFQNERQNLLTKIEQIQHEFNFAQKSLENSEKESISKISSLEDRLRRQISQKQKAIEELQQKQMEHLNLQLDLHFKLRQKTEKSQIELAKSIENPNRKSFNVSQQVSSNDLIPASKTLKQIISSRSRGLVEKRMEVMVVRITQLQQQIYSNVSVSKEKGLILEKTRLMSMQFSKLKVSIMKGKLPNEDRMKLLTALRPIENTIKDILKLSEIHCQN